MGKYIPVEPEKWAEMVKALALVKEMDKTIIASQAECRRLKAEVDRLRVAGYAMACKINVHGINDRFTDSQKLVSDWSAAAKEVQS